MEYKRVLFLHHVSCLGGAERYLVSLIEQLDDRFEPYFICQNPGALTEVLNRMGVPATFIKMRAWRRFKFAFFNLLSVWKIFGYCKAHKIDVICCNAYRVAPYAVIAAKRLGIPCVTVIHDFVPYIKLKRFKVFQSDVVVSVSENIQRTVAPHFKKDTLVIYNGIDAADFQQLAARQNKIREELGLKPEQKIIGIVANLIPLKGHTLFLKAMQIVARKHPEAVFAVIGEVLDTNQLTLDDLKTAAAELNVSGQTHFLGYRDDVPDLIAGFDVLVVASDREAFGRVLIEAMALKKPVVATRCGGPEEIVEDGVNGFLVEKDDEAAMAEAVLKLLEDDLLRSAFGEKGFAAVNEKFALSKTVTRFNEVLDR